MSLYADTYGKYSTSSSCFSIEHLLEKLNEKRRNLEELWKNRKQKLEQCIQICFLKDEIKRTLNWIIHEGEKYIEDSRLGTNYKEAIELQNLHADFEKKYHAPIHDSVMQNLRTADQFIHTGLEKADEAHQEAHVMLEKWEKFALKLDQRRKLLSIVVSFYKQTEDATERLLQIEKEIKREEEKIRKATHSKSKSSTRTSNISPNAELAQRHADLTNKLTEITGPSLREGRIVLEKVDKEDFETEHVIKRVYEFTEHVKDLKTKLSNDIQDKLINTAESETETKRMTEIIEFENKYNNVFSWITNVGESFLTHHRDMGVDIAYVSDYMDNHQQMMYDLKENENEFNNVIKTSESILKQIETEKQQIEIRQNIEIMQQKWHKLKKSVEKRILVAEDYLTFVKQLNQFRNLALDLQELFKNLSDHLSNSSDSIFEQHVQEKMSKFESLYKEVVLQGQTCIAALKKSDIETLKLNLNHMVSDIEIMLNDSNSLYESIKSNLSLWREKKETKKVLKEEWHEFMAKARRLIQKTVDIEENILPKLIGDFSDSLEVAESYQKNFDDFMPSVKVCQD